MPTVGVAETSLPVVNIHFGINDAAFEELRYDSAGWLRKFAALWPATGHCTTWANATKEEVANRIALQDKTQQERRRKAFRKELIASVPQPEWPSSAALVIRRNL